MKRLVLFPSESTFVDTPRGIFTDAGNWFRTREAWLQEYAAAVLEKLSLGRLLFQAEVWLRSAQALTLWILPLLLLYIPPMQCVLAALVVYVGWSSLGPSFVSRTLFPVFRALDSVFLQALYYIVTMSWAANNEQYIVLGIGMGGFLLLRWGVVSWVTRPVIKWIWHQLYRLPVTDHVLRAFIIRAALKHRIIIADFEAIEEQILRNHKSK